MTRMMIGLAFLALGAATLLGAAPVRAQEFHHGEDRNREDNLRYQQHQREEAAARQRDREWRDHERRAARWRRAHEVDPGYVYAPPPVVYSPPPAASFTLTIPFDIR
jgi:hypothetical protein